MFINAYVGRKIHNQKLREKIGGEFRELLIVCFSLNNTVNKCKWIGLASFREAFFFIVMDEFYFINSWLLGILLRAFNIRKFFLRIFSYCSLSLFRNSNFYCRDC